jgi:hypothetical protein
MAENRYDISIVLPTDSSHRIQPVIVSIRSALVARSLEVIVVCPHAAAADFNDDVKVVAIPDLYPLSAARAAGIREASASYVFIGETHSFPRPGMFDALVASHKTGATVAIPAFENENPATLVSWAGFINGYAPWSTGRNGGGLNHAPLFNASYDRGFLVEMGGNLESILTSGEDMMARLTSNQRRVSFEPRAVIGHVNISQLKPWLLQRIVAGRVIASVRSSAWSSLRRLAYTLGAPLIPVVLMNRHRRSIARTIRSNSVSAALWPVLCLGMFFQAFGESLGYALGRDAESEHRYDAFEIEQMDYA